MDQPQPESILGHYKIVRRLGAGGMGVVYEAEDMKLGRHVAVKCLSGAADPAALERFWREARAASALNHPGICTLYEINESQTQPFLVMELLEGQSLDSLYGGRAVPLKRLAELGMQIADALEAAHRKGILHRDIKPANIFVTSAGQTKILDFGLARFEDRASNDTADTGLSERQLLTTPGSTLGTIAYMSPEQARGEILDARSDIFSLGVVLYELGTGKHPFEGTTTAVVFDKLLNYIPIAPISLNQELPAEFEGIINKALEKDRDLRYQSAADLRADLKRMQRISSSSSRIMASAVNLPVASSYPGMSRHSVAVVHPAASDSAAIQAATTTAASGSAASISASLRAGAQQQAADEDKGGKGRSRGDRTGFRQGLAIATLIVIATTVATRLLHKTPTIVIAPAPVAAQSPAPAAVTPSAPPTTPAPAAATPAPAVIPIASTSKPSASTPSNPVAPDSSHKASTPHHTTTAAPAPASAPATPPPATTPAPAATTPASTTPPASHVPPAAPAPAAHPSAFATVSYSARHVHAFPYVGGRFCKGTLQLTAENLVYTSDTHDLTLTRAQVSAIDGNGVVDSDGKKWHFEIPSMTNAQVHDLLARWFAAGPH